MGYKGNNLGQKLIAGLAYNGAAVTTGNTGTGVSIVEPWQTGRQIMFIFLCKAIASTSLVLSFEGRLRGTSTWVQYKAANDEKIQVDTAVSNALVTGDVLKGTLDLTRFTGETYDALRVLVKPTGGTDEVSVAYVLGDLYEVPNSQADALFSIQRFGEY